MAKTVICDWPESSPTTYLDHYEVWRKTGSGGTYAKISGDIAQGTLTYTDTSTLSDSTEYFYEVRAYNATGDYNAVENSIIISGSSIIVMQDDFAGTDLAGNNNWTVTDPADGIDISQNDDIIFTDNTGGVVVNHSLNYIDGVNSFSGGVDTQCFQINNVNISNIPTFPTFRFWDGTNDNKIEITKDSTDQISDLIRIIVKVGTVTTYSFISAIPYKDSRVKIEVTATEQKFYYWNGSAWIQIGVTQTEDFTGVTLNPMITAQTNFQSGANDTCGATGVFQTNAIYSTVSPT